MTAAAGSSGLSLLVIRARDVELARSFYELLGLQFESEKHGSGPEHYAATLRGGTVLEIYPSRGGERPESLRLGLRVAQPEAAVLRVEAAGLSTLASAVTGRGTVAHVLRDPDGNYVELTALTVD